jgi:hypothetical protein
VGVEQPPQRLAERLHHLPVVRLLQVGRREASREQQPVALAHRQVEALGEVDEQLAARARAAGLDEAEVLGREVRLQRELELAQMPARPPETDQLTDGQRLALGLDDHPGNRSGRPLGRLYLFGKATALWQPRFTREVIDVTTLARHRYGGAQPHRQVRR